MTQRPPAGTGGGHALAGDMAVEPQLVQELAGHGAVIAGVQVAGAVAGQRAVQLLAGGLQGGVEQR